MGRDGTGSEKLPTRFFLPISAFYGPEDTTTTVHVGGQTRRRYRCTTRSGDPKCVYY